MFSKLFGCFNSAKSHKLAVKNTVIDPQLTHENQPEAAATETGFLRRILKRRRAKKEEILLFEKRYLKKYLRYHNLYVSGMSLEEMWIAKRFILMASDSEPNERAAAGEDRRNICQHCCHCFGCPPAGDSEADPKMTMTTMGKRVTFDAAIQSRSVEKPLESMEAKRGECSDATTTCCDNQETTVMGEDECVPDGEENEKNSVMERLGTEEDLGLYFCVGSDGGPTYVSFEQPEP